MTEPVRYLIEGVLETLSPLHIGSGEPTERPGLEVETPEGEKRPAEISAVVLDSEGRAYLPGRALKGTMRSWLSRRLPADAHRVVEEVFGSEEAHGREDQGGTSHVGGKAEVWNAFLSELPAIAPLLPYWDADRGAAVRASVALDRCTRTASDERLFFEEFVPPGCRFRVRVSGQNLSDEELDLLLVALEGFGQSVDPASLGVGYVDGHGRCSWSLGAVRRLDGSDLPPWFSEDPPNVGFQGLPVLPSAARDHVVERAARRWTLAEPRRLDVALEIRFTSPFLVASPRRKAEDEGGSGEADRIPVTDALGRPLLPSSSLRGALRGRAERILRTLGLRACRPERTNEGCRAVHHAHEVARLCPACRLFGAPGWAALLRIPDFELAPGTEPLLQTFEHLAIDRFTGGVSGALKFNDQAFVGARLHGRLRLDLERQVPSGEAGESAPAVEPWMVGLLALVLRDLVDGDIALGYGAARGYGACRGEIKEIECRGSGGLSLDDGGQPLPDEVAWAQGQAVPATLRKALAWVVASLHGEARGQATDGEWTPTPLPAAQGPAAPKAASAAKDTNLFHNPYHFLPLGPAMEDPEGLSAGSLGTAAAGGVCHDRYLTGDSVYSGRLVYRVKTDTPTVVGAARSQEDPSEAAVVEPFELEGEPALPGSTLRGLLSSLAEAATGSAMRVLEDRSLSYRLPMRASLPALGRLVEGQDGSLFLEPVALPQLECDQYKRPLAAPAKWRSLFPQPVLRVYVNGYQGKGKDGVRLIRSSFLGRRRPLSASSSRPEDRWYFPLGQLAVWDPAGPPWMPNPHIKETEDKQGNKSYRLVAQDSSADSARLEMAGLKIEPITKEQFEAITDPAIRSEYVPGILRVLEIEGHETEIPAQRTHEIFIPLPEDAERPRLAAAEAVREFHRLADERTAADGYLPFSLRGKGRDEKGRVRLGAGDVVFLDVDESGKVLHLALSSIWRASAGTVFDYIPPNLQPFNPGRSDLSNAERLFGFVEQGMESLPAGQRRAARALASRVWCSFGRLEKGQDEPFYQVEEPRLARILASPKPPAPALYFRRKSAAPALIRKRDLRRGGREPMGRKVYLHALGLAPKWQQQPIGDARDRLRSRLRPLRKHLRFLAHLDFDNLTERELALLCYVLRPTPAFRHKLGMGKPLGLGSVEITPLGLFLVDRHERYQEDADLLATPRYHRVSFVPPGEEGGLAAAYPKEIADAQHQAVKPGPNIADFVSRFRAAMPAAVRWTLELLGDPAAVQYPVLYPRTAEQDEDAEEGFKWFVENENHAGQQLQPVAQGGDTPPTELPTLSRRHEPQSHSPGTGGRRRGAGRAASAPTGQTSSPGQAGTFRGVLGAELERALKKDNKDKKD